MCDARPFHVAVVHPWTLLPELKFRAYARHFNSCTPLRRVKAEARGWQALVRIKSWPRFTVVQAVLDQLFVGQAASLLNSHEISYYRPSSRKRMTYAQHCRERNKFLPDHFDPNSPTIQGILCIIPRRFLLPSDIRTKHHHLRGIPGSFD